MRKHTHQIEKRRVVWMGMERSKVRRNDQENYSYGYAVYQPMLEKKVTLPGLDRWSNKLSTGPLPVTLA